MTSLVDDAERLVLDFILGSSLSSPTQPLFLRLMASNGSESAAGTEITGDSYDPQAMSFASSVTASGVTTSSNSVDIVFPALDSLVSKSVAGYEIWDNSDTPIRMWQFPFGSPINIAAGQSVKFATGTIVVTSD